MSKKIFLSILMAALSAGVGTNAMEKNGNISQSDNSESDSEANEKICFVQDTLLNDYLNTKFSFFGCLQQLIFSEFKDICGEDKAKSYIKYLYGKSEYTMSDTSKSINAVLTCSSTKFKDGKNPFYLIHLLSALCHCQSTVINKADIPCGSLKRDIDRIKKRISDKIILENVFGSNADGAADRYLEAIFGTRNENETYFCNAGKAIGNKLVEHGQNFIINSLSALIALQSKVIDQWKPIIIFDDLD